ncbi:MAG TPA: protein-glutamate O-methyltransferase CheR [Gemmatimonadaceae bacterium]|nr:protein-glutamate O-methyltransferase CheR [Gemmatimonadaceae bacterium]
MTAARARHVATPRAQGWTDPAFARVAEVVHLVSGLVFPPNRQPAAEAGMRRAMASLRIADPDALGRAVQGAGEARDAVLAELTVGETYFFRESGQLDVLRTDILPSLLEKRSDAAPLRIWSAGSASGEEPYTLAILLRELGWPHAARILGTDISRPRLASAQRGRYTRWSLRGVSEERIARWFERRGSHFQLDRAITAAVQFAPLNLIADEYPSAATTTLGQDVVLCRNVLIYFDMESVALIAARLLASLAPDGWLLLGASDPPLNGLVPCEVVMTPGGVVYRRADRAPASERTATFAFPIAATEATWLSPLSPLLLAPAAIDVDAVVLSEESGLERNEGEVASIVVLSEAKDPHVQLLRDAQDDNGFEPELAAYLAADYARAETLARESLARDAGRLAPWVVLVRALANQGRLREADEECVRALDLHRLAPELHYLHATLLRAADQHREAANAARRALYLDSRFVMAHLQLGDLLAHLGETPRAARAFERAARELDGLSDDEPVPAADGVSASRLRQIADMRLRGMNATPPR